MSKLSDFVSLVNTEVDGQLELIVGNDLPILKELKAFVIESGGKRVRPVLLLLLSSSFKCHDKNAQALAAITEIIHAASLLHDDVIDDAKERRGRPSGRVLFGNRSVVLGGDYLLACGIERLNRFNNQQLMDIFTRVIKHLSVAELLQMQYEGRPEITLDIYQRIIYGKTAVLFEAAAVSAGVYSKQSKATLDDLRSLGHELGLLFQIRDDTLDYFKASLLKKPALSDYDNGLYTFPILNLRERCNEATAQRLDHFMKMSVEQRQQKNTHKQFLVFLHEQQVEEHCLQEVSRLAKSIFSKIDALPQDEYIQMIREQIAKLSDI